MSADRTPIGNVKLRRVPRAGLCVRAEIDPEGRERSEHLTVDVSVAGFRICGEPDAAPGDEVRVRLAVGAHGVSALGEIMWQSSNQGRPEVGIRLDGPSEVDQGLLESAVEHALTHDPLPSVAVWIGADEAVAPVWIESLPGIRRIRDLEDLLPHLERGSIGTVVAMPSHVRDLAPWVESHPDVSWRTIDARGRLRGEIAS